MKLARSILSLVALLSLAVTPAAAQQQDAATMGRSVTTLAKVPLTSRDGAAIRLGSRITKGKPTLIAFWASWCAPCVAEAPYLNRIRRDLGSNVNFLYVNRRDGDPDRDQPQVAVTRFLARSGMADVDYLVAGVPAYRQIVGADLKSIPEGLVGIPRVYLFDREGRQIYTSMGFRPSDSAEIERLIRQELAAR